MDFRHFGAIRPLVLFVVIVGTAVLSVNTTMRAEPVPQTAPDTVFSATRALQHVRVLAQAPRVMGTKPYGDAIEYISGQLNRLGFHSEIQQTFSQGGGINSQWYSSVDNIVAREPGLEPQGAILLTAHFDSGFLTPGANDDASGVAVLLEVARALEANPPVKNTVIFLFAGQEEVADNGAQAFIEQQPWAGEVKLVINLDNGGTGPAMLLNTSSENGWLIRGLAWTSPSVLASSAFLGHDDANDFGRVFKPEGFSGYSFNYASAPRQIHSTRDTVGIVNLGGMQQEGDQILALVRYFGGSDLRDSKEPDPIFFPILHLGIIRYSAGFGVLLMGCTTLIFAGVLVVGLRHKRLTGFGTAISALLLLVGGLVAIGIAFLLWLLVISRIPFYRFLFMGQPYRVRLLMTLFSAIVIAGVATSLSTLQRIWRAGLPDITMGAQAVLLLVTIGTSVFMPGISYLFTWPALLGLLAAGYGLLFGGFKENAISLIQLLLLLLTGALSVLLVFPFIVLGELNLPIGEMYLPLLVLVALLLSLAPHLSVASRGPSWALPLAAGLAAVVLLIAAVTARNNPREPEAVTGFYFKDEDTGEAYWAAGSPAYPVLDSWSRQFFADGARQHILASDRSPLFNPAYFTSAPDVNLPSPEVRLIQESVRGETRELKLHFSSGGAPELHVWPMDRDLAVVSIQINGMPCNVNYPEGWWFAYSFMPPQGVDVLVRLRGPNIPVRLLLAAISYGLPEIPGRRIAPMPEGVFVNVYASRFAYQTVVTRQVVLDRPEE